MENSEMKISFNCRKCGTKISGILQGRTNAKLKLIKTRNLICVKCFSTHSVLIDIKIK